MYLSGSKWNMRKRRRRSNPWLALALVALLIGPNSAQAHGAYAWALDFMGGEENLTKAREEIDRALQIDPNSALTQAFLAEILMDSSPENYKEALDAAQRAGQIDANLMEAHRALG